MKKELFRDIYRRHEDNIKDFPYYIREFLERMENEMSINTIYNYGIDYNIFLNWLRSEGLYTGEVKDMPASILEELKPIDIDNFRRHVKNRRENDDVSIARKISALRKLFEYLSVGPGGKGDQPYITFNVMERVKVKMTKVDASARMEVLSTKILKTYEDFFAFKEYIASGFGEEFKENKKIMHNYHKNRERDVAIICLLLASGLRLSELVGLDVEEINVDKCECLVFGKGNTETMVQFSIFAQDALREYIAIRNERYNLPKKHKPLFVSSQKPNGRMTQRAVQLLVEKYAKAFGIKDMTVHKLRHSFATEYYLRTGDIIGLKTQLRHESIETTNLYTQLDKSQRRKNLDDGIRQYLRAEVSVEGINEK
ncbi:tyrosine recombinase XerS [Aneurinibacillus migulanus]|uniref:tyrosine recombinase XerS n=1 Tax=Aneurinibacillus migulanus TaxID=47500 RepID=UPI002E213EE9|nr:tyrosine recombinase XerS [Aneurinibacillus migulanus]MED4728358.1 tyrosine recombinase XerS [Aneurinibacillus migulanus]